jgi:ArsR family transcriptional regulator
MTDVRTLAIEHLRERLDSGRPLEFWNVQTDKWFTGEMIPGSRRVPLDTIARDTVNVPMDAEIVTYCAGPQCSQSTQAAQKLIELGYTNVRAFTGGLSGWKAAGQSTENQQEPVPAA